jgi:hypothetical protein
MAADWRQRLREALDDPDRGGMAPDAARSIRQLVVAEAWANHGAEAGWSWKRPVAIAAMVVLLIAIGMSGGRRAEILPRTDSSSSPSAEGFRDRPGDLAPASRRQLLFSTPGGTRVIWVFDSDLRLKGTTP